MDVVVTTSATQPVNVRRGDEVQISLHIMDMFHMLPASPFRLFEALLALCIKGEKAMGIELGSPFREPVLKFALKFPQQTVDFFLCRLSERSLSRLFHSFLSHKDGRPLRDSLAASCQKIIAMTFTPEAAGPLAGKVVSGTHIYDDVYLGSSGKSLFII